MEPNPKKNLFLCSKNLQINLFLQKEKNLTFQQNFTYLRKKLQIKLTRKTYIDSILKKCKGRFFKAINDCLRKCTFIYIHKLPQKFITDISISYNKNFLNYTTIDLYRYFNLKPFNKEDKIEKSNFCIKGKETYLKFILSYIPNFVILTSFVYVFVKLLHWNHILVYLLAALIAIPITYVLVKIFTFKERK